MPKSVSVWGWAQVPLLTGLAQDSQMKVMVPARGGVKEPAGVAKGKGTWIGRFLSGILAQGCLVLSVPVVVLEVAGTLSAHLVLLPVVVTPAVGWVSVLYRRGYTSRWGRPCPWTALLFRVMRICNRDAFIGCVFVICSTSTSSYSSLPALTPVDRRTDPPCCFHVLHHLLPQL